MRDFVLIYINGRRYQVKGTDAFLSLADFLRLRLGLVGTKIVCNEGDCGACSVLTGRPKGESIVYRVVDSCIQFMFQLDGCHIVTVEGLKLNGQLHPIQQAMVRCHASQCGFCTPGFLVMLAGLREYKDRLDDADVRQGLTGNLCRCTGYVQIIEAALALDDDAGQRMGELYPPQSMLVELRAHASTSICVRCMGTQGERIFFSPTDLPTAIQCLADHPQARIVAGATDVGVQINKGTLRPAVIVDLNRVPDLDTVHVEEGVLVAGARSSWTDIEHACQDVVPEFHRILTLFGSPQIRNVATIGGNIANGSPVADSLPFLLVMEAELILEGPAGMRQININDFYVGYKQIDLRPGELIEAATTMRRMEIREERKANSVPFEEFYEAERKLITEGGLIDPITDMLRGSMQISSHWAKAFKAFWNLDADFTI